MPRQSYTQKRTREFTELCRRHRLCLEQGANALKHKRPSIAAGCVRRAEAIQVQIEQHCREDRCRGLLDKRHKLTVRLQTALRNNQEAEAAKLSGELAALDCQIEAA